MPEIFIYLFIFRKMKKIYGVLQMNRMFSEHYISMNFWFQEHLIISSFLGVARPFLHNSYIQGCCRFCCRICCFLFNWECCVRNILITFYFWFKIIIVKSCQVSWVYITYINVPTTLLQYFIVVVD